MKKMLMLALIGLVSITMVGCSTVEGASTNPNYLGSILDSASPAILEYVEQQIEATNVDAPERDQKVMFGMVTVITLGVLDQYVIVGPEQFQAKAPQEKVAIVAAEVVKGVNWAKEKYNVDVATRVLQIVNVNGEKKQEIEVILALVMDFLSKRANIDVGGVTAPDVMALLPALFVPAQ